jgi:hypothetical protein
MNMNPMPQQPTQPGGATPQQVAFFNSIFRENCPFKFVFGGVTGTLKGERDGGAGTAAAAAADLSISDQ